MREWTNRYNPFNSMKVLIHRESLEGMAKRDFLPPIYVNTDPSNRCNFNCIWCNAFECKMNPRMKDIPRDHLIRLADFYAEWGVKATCFAGGGEPFMNKYSGECLLRLHENNIQVGVVTNGSLLTDELIEVIVKTSRWLGFSMDAATNNTFMKVKGIEDKRIFEKVLVNIEKATKKARELNTECDIGFKFLLHPLNAKEIYEAAKLAKSLGVKDFQVRPVGWDNIYKTENEEPICFDSFLEDINRQLEESIGLEDNYFGVFGIRHKFESNFQQKKKLDYSRCWASPIHLTFGADGYAYICLDMRGNKDLILCSHYPDPHEVLGFWNKERHHQILDNIDIQKCPRCTFGAYNEIVEHVFVKDNMCRNFM